MDSSAVISLAEEVVAGLRFAYSIKDAPYRDSLLSVIRDANLRVNAALPIKRPPSRRETLPPQEDIGATDALPSSYIPYRAFLAAISPLVRGNMTDVGKLWRLSAEVGPDIDDRIDWAKAYVRNGP